MSSSTMPQHGLNSQPAYKSIYPNNEVPLHIIRLKEYLDSNGIKLGVVARKIGLTPSWITKVLNGQRTTPVENFRKIEKLLKIKLFDTEEDATVLRKKNQE